MIKKPFLWLISLYRIMLSPILPPSCRFHPSCSVYAQEAIEGHGVVRGIFYAIKRVLRCHPYGPGGYDPVPCAKTREHGEKMNLHEASSGVSEERIRFHKRGKPRGIVPEGNIKDRPFING